MSGMKRASDYVPRQAGVGGVLLAGILILGFCVWNYWYLILETNDRIPRDLEPFIPQVAEVRQDEVDTRVGVYNSASTQRFYQRMDFRYASILDSWRDFLRSLGLPYDDFYQIDKIRDYDLVILPFTSCLSDYEAGVIKSFVAGGGRLFMTGTVGARDEEGTWRDVAIFSDLVGARFIGNANPTPLGPASLQLNRDLPISLRWTPRRSIEIPSYNEVLVLRPVGNRMKIVASVPFYRDDETFEMLPAFCYGPYLKGRIAWSGVGIASAPNNDPTARRAFGEMFANVIVWLAQKPSVTTPTWPFGKEAALAILVDATGISPLRLLAMIDELDRPLGVLVNPKQANDFAKISGIGNFDIEWILNVDGEYFDILKSSEGLSGLSNLKHRVEESLNTKVRGVRVPGMKPRDIARQSVREGFEYLLAPPTDGIDSFPEIFASVRNLGPLEAPDVISLAPYQSGLPAKISPTDCFFVLLNAEQLSGITPPLRFRGVDEDRDLWVPFPRDIVAWRANRNAVVMNEEFLPDNRLRVSISNGSYSEFYGFPFSINFGESVEEVLVWPKAVGQPKPELISKVGGVWSYSISRFRPGMTLEYIFTPRAGAEVQR